MERQAPASSAPEEGFGYPGTTVAAALLATLFFPVISLIVALLLVGNQQDPTKRRALRTWAWAAGGWLALQALIALILILSIATSAGTQTDRSGPCVGGPEIGAAGKDISGNGTKFVIPCSISGTTTVKVPSH
jgi:hypothetical protein